MSLCHRCIGDPFMSHLVSFHSFASRVIMDQFVLCFTALGSLGQGVPLLWQQETILDMLEEKEKKNLANSGFARWCLMGHQGCLHIVLATFCVMSAMLYEVRERFFLHVLLFIYNGSAIFYHLRMWNSAGGQAPIWFAKADTFWFNVYALIASSIANAIGVIASYLKMTQQ